MSFFFLLILQLSLWDNTYSRTCLRSKTQIKTSGPEQITKEKLVEPNLIIELLSDPNLYIIIIAYGLFSLRLQSYTAWLSAGWPEWASGSGKVNKKRTFEIVLQ